MHLDPVADQILLSCWDLAIADDISFPAVIGLFTAGPECDLLKWRFELDAAGEVIRQTEMDEGRLRSFRSSESSSVDFGNSHSWWAAPCTVAQEIRGTFVEISHVRRSRHPLRNHSLFGGGSRQYFHCHNGIWAIGDRIGFWTI